MRARKVPVSQSATRVGRPIRGDRVGDRCCIRSDDVPTRLGEEPRLLAPGWGGRPSALLALPQGRRKMKLLRRGEVFLPPEKLAGLAVLLVAAPPEALPRLAEPQVVDGVAGAAGVDCGARRTSAELE